MNYFLEWQKWLFAARAFSSSLLRVIIAHNHLPFFKIFWNFVHFCPNFQIFCSCLLVFNNFLPFFCPFFWKFACMPLVSRIGPGSSILNSFHGFLKCNWNLGVEWVLFFNIFLTSFHMGMFFLKPGKMFEFSTTVFINGYLGSILDPWQVWLLHTI